MFEFTVIDPKTGKYPDLCEVALHEEWAKGLIYCDMEGFAITEDGHLVLLDECGGERYCPTDRFIVIFEQAANVEAVQHGWWQYVKTHQGFKYVCSICGEIPECFEPNYCPNCGAKMDGEDGAK